MGLRARTPSIKNLDGNYSSSVRMGKMTKYSPVKPPRQFATPALSTRLHSAVKVK